MSLREAAQQALEALEYLDGYNGWVEVGKEIADLQIALADTQDGGELEALRASLREHMAEIHRLRAAGRQALEALEYMHGKYTTREIYDLRAALAEDAMQRLTDVQQEIENGANTVQSPSGIYSRVFDSGDRNVEAVTNCHDKEGDKLSPPLPILAVHVGYRYQSPVGGWEYGDHIPAGFDTDKWAHQKIYILQEQS